MSTARSVFTEVIEDHLALKKQNVALEAAMPLARYDVGDPLDRYPGGPNRGAEGTVVVAEDAAGEAVDFDTAVDDPTATQATQLMVGPSPEQAMEAATALEPTFADRPFEPLTGMAPMLSLVEDIDDEDEDDTPTAVDTRPSGDVLRFPGGVGPREEAIEPTAGFTGQVAMETEVLAAEDAFAPHEPQAAAPHGPAGAMAHDAPTGEQPVLVIDTEEPLGMGDFAEPAAPVRSSRRKPRFFGLGRKKTQDDAAEGWFTDGPRDFNWD